MRRPTRALTRLLAAATMLAALGTAAPAYAHDYQFWYALPQAKVYKTTTRPTTYGRAAVSTSRPTMYLRAARGEFEGRQIAIRPTAGNISSIWITPTNLTMRGPGTAGRITFNNVSVYKVHYVNIATPSYGMSRRGLEPDALLPMTLANGNALGSSYRAAANNNTQPFYVLFRVPDSTKPGTYSGKLKVSAMGTDGTRLPDVWIPVRLTVYPFSIEKRTLRTSFGMSLNWAMYANSSTHKWLGQLTYAQPGYWRVAERTTFKADQIGSWLRYMSDHRVSPQTHWPAWQAGSNSAPPTGTGAMVARHNYLDDYLGSGSATTFDGKRYNFNSVQMPELTMQPSYIKNPFSSTSSRTYAARYYSTMYIELGAYGSKALIYPIDEPPASLRPFIEKYALFAKKYAPGAKFMLTTDPKSMGNKPVRGVDIYVNRLHFFYRDLPGWINPLRKLGKQQWIYSHAGIYQSEVPNYLIDKPLTDPRAMGWFAYHTRADGLLYFNINAWRNQMKSTTYRDPYRDTISYRSTWAGAPVYSNGDGSLVYPGYYPALGLTVQGAPPVGSLRMEALRDGLEDYEYVKALEAKAGRTTALSYVSGIIGKPATVRNAGSPTFPAYSKSATVYENQRNAIAARISR